VVLRGELELTVGLETRVLKAGDAYAFKSTIPHRFRNLGSEVCELVSACTPPSF
jgi:mannose-6-phosphate isomerase-like protein (cupin superfamily)